MVVTNPLPKFRHPPVDEVAVGVQFAALGFLPTHYGAFHERVKQAFPGVQAMPPVPPVFEVISAPAAPSNPGNFLPMQMGIAGGFALPLWPRTLFISEDECSLIQLQNDRLYFNWRRRPDNEYPHYEHVRRGFSDAYVALETFVSDQSLGPISPNQCEVLYVNLLSPGVTGVEPSAPEKAFRIWNSVWNEEGSKPLEDLAFNARYRLADDTGKQFGRLTANMSTGSGPDHVQAMRLELTARGVPRGSGLDGILAFLDVGHEAIVRCFAAITTQAMHDRWERYQ